MSFRATRVVKSADILVHAVPDRAFELFTPLGERKWVPGWVPVFVFPITGETGQHMVFKTPAKFEGEEDYLWIVTQIQEGRYVEYAVSTVNRIWFIHVTIKPQGEYSIVTVNYTFTSLNEVGEQLDNIAANQMFVRGLKDWEEAVNYFISTGSKIMS